MSGTAAYNYTVSVSTSQSGTYYEVKTNSATFDVKGDVLDDTDTTNAGYHTRVIGLMDWSVSFEANYVTGDTAMGTIRTALLGRSALWVKVMPTTTAGEGYKGPCVVENFSTGLGVSELETLSVSLQGNGALVADNA